MYIYTCMYVLYGGIYTMDISILFTLHDVLQPCSSPARASKASRAATTMTAIAQPGKPPFPLPLPLLLSVAAPVALAVLVAAGVAAGVAATVGLAVGLGVGDACTFAFLAHSKIV